jgi:WD40 repeat protein
MALPPKYCFVFSITKMFQFSYEIAIIWYTVDYSWYLSRFEKPHVTQIGRRTTGINFTIAFAKYHPNLLAVGGEGSDVEIVKLMRNRGAPNVPPVKRYSINCFHNALFSLKWFENDRLLATGSGDQALGIQDVTKGRTVTTLLGHKGSVKSIDVHFSNKDLLASGGRDGQILIWDLRKGETQSQLINSYKARWQPHMPQAKYFENVKFMAPVLSLLDSHSNDKVMKKKHRCERKRISIYNFEIDLWNIRSSIFLIT